MRRTGIWFVGAVIALSPSAGWAQTAKAQTTTNAPATSKVEAPQVFVSNALRGSLAEVELGKLAVEKSTNADVKKFGQRMVDDHAKAANDLKALAMTKQIQVPTSIGRDEQALRDRLSRLSGSAFDRAYIQAMLSDHVKDVTAFKNQADASPDADVKAFAASTLRTLQDHLDMVRNLDKTVVGTSGAKDRQSDAIDKENHGASGNGTPTVHTPTGDVPRTNQ